MDIPKIEKVIALLQHGYEKPGMRFLDFSHCIGFVWGINAVCHDFDVVSFELHNTVHHEVAAELGWKYQANSPAMSIMEMDWEEHRKIRAFLKIEIETWQRIIQLGTE